MPEFRTDPITGRRVIIAPRRALRPIDCGRDFAAPDGSSDPFAAGNESATPPAILTIADPAARAGEDANWSVRVVPNKYPAVTPEGDPRPRPDGLFESRDAVGSHEVIVECPEFETNLSRLPNRQILNVLLAYRRRMRDLAVDPRYAHALIFKNQGTLAGTSQPHCHSQLIASNVVPFNLAEELAAARRHYETNGRCIYETILDAELADGKRIVAEEGGFIAICPFASRVPYETWILPREPASHFERIGDASLEALAPLLKRLLAKIESLLDNAAFNHILHSAPFNPPELPYFRWRLEIIPRTSHLAGYEWGSGHYINTIPPEEAAAKLRPET